MTPMIFPQNFSWFMKKNVFGRKFCFSKVWNQTLEEKNKEKVISNVFNININNGNKTDFISNLNVYDEYERKNIILSSIQKFFDSKEDSL